MDLYYGQDRDDWAICNITQEEHTQKTRLTAFSLDINMDFPTEHNV